MTEKRTEIDDREARPKIERETVKDLEPTDDKADDAKGGGGQTSGMAAAC